MMNVANSRASTLMTTIAELCRGLSLNELGNVDDHRVSGVIIALNSRTVGDFGASTPSMGVLLWGGVDFCRRQMSISPPYLVPVI